MIQIKRVYDPPSKSDGERILIDRLWPRGLSKEKVDISVWLKDVAPSNELRKWFHHEESNWEEFRRRYWKELDQNPGPVEQIRERANKGTITLLYSARDEQHNQAVALQEYLEQHKG
jgi:uncharacterized protein YeaO (DUF488 family)